MKKFLFAIGMALATTATFAQTSSIQQPPAKSAQAATTVEQRAEAITASMVRNLRLSAQQEVKLRAVNLTSMQNVEKAKQKYSNNPRKLMAQMNVISETRLSQIKDILTPLQFQQYQQRREEKMGVPQEAQSNPEARQRSPLNQESY